MSPAEAPEPGATGPRRPGLGAEATLLVLLAAAAAGGRGSDSSPGLFSRLAGGVTGAAVQGMDVDAIIEDVDVDALVQRIDVNALLERVDVDALVQRMDVDALMAQVDIDALVSRVDVDALVSRVDMNALLDGVDVPALVDRAGIADIVAESTGTMAGRALDVLRRQLVAVDEILGRVAYRVLRGDPTDRPDAPVKLEGLSAEATTTKGRGHRTGFFAGPVTRTVAFGIDILTAFLTGTLIVAGLSFVGGMVGIAELEEWLGGVLIVVWIFSYFAFSLALTARTIGKAIIGLSVVAADGSRLKGRRGLLRTAVEPFSFLFLGLGCLVMLVSKERHTMHDAIAKTAVVYDWGDRPADIPAPITAWIERRQDGE